MLAAYCWPQSVRAGQAVALHCHGDEAGPVTVRVIREGAEPVSVFALERLDVRPQVVGANAAAEGCDWAPSVELEVAADWPSGFYRVELTDAEGGQAHAFFVVRAVEPCGTLLVLSTSTWAAYNNWGGPSFYTGGHTVGLRRPLPPGFLAKTEPERFRVARFQDWTSDDRQTFDALGYSPWCMAAGWANQELLFVRWAERAGFKFDYAISEDLHAGPGVLSGCSTYLSVGHDEYWSGAMRDTVETFIDGGGNAAFFSGNTSFWQVRFDAATERMTCYKTAIRDDPHYAEPHAPTLSTMWSDPLVGRPESNMTGVSFTRGGYAHMPGVPQGTGGYRVWQNGHWAFEGLHFERGDDLGAEPVVVGYECDGCELLERDGVPVAAGNAPAGFEVLATAPARLWETHEALGAMDDSYIGELNWVAERLGGEDNVENRARYSNGHAVLGTFRRGKGQVFTTGCTDWAYGLGQPDVDIVTRNVLRQFARAR